ncbi:hypothetical protein [Gordonia soli]|nr:hypothetical protein [Gordonia soli]
MTSGSSGTPRLIGVPAPYLQWARWAAVGAVAAALGHEAIAIAGNRMSTGGDDVGGTLVLGDHVSVFSGVVGPHSTGDSADFTADLAPQIRAGVDHRLRRGRIGWCWSWDGEWHDLGQTCTDGQVAGSVPPGWSTTQAAQQIFTLIGEPDHQDGRDAVFGLVRRCETRAVTPYRLRDVVSRVAADSDRGIAVLAAAGVLGDAPGVDVPGVDGISEAAALAAVRDWLARSALDLSDYPPENLSADPLEFGWHITNPVRSGFGANFDRISFYITHSGELIESTRIRAILPEQPQAFADLCRRAHSR